MERGCEDEQEQKERASYSFSRRWKSTLQSMRSLVAGGEEDRSNGIDPGDHVRKK